MIETERLLLRGWQPSDTAPFHALCNDPRVMETIGPPLSAEQVEAAMAQQNDYLAAHSYCFWAIERTTDGAMLGFCGLKPGAAGTPIADQVEIGWRLAHAHWGKGYAREAATASLAWAWARGDIDAVYAITTPGNARSWGLMERLGMVRVAGGDFDHPDVPDGDPLKRHLQYRAQQTAT